MAKHNTWDDILRNLLSDDETSGEPTYDRTVWINVFKSTWESVSFQLPSADRHLKWCLDAADEGAKRWHKLNRKKETEAAPNDTGSE